MQNFLSTHLGASWRTTLVGWGAGLLLAVATAIQAGGVPQTSAQWMQVLSAVFIAYLGQSSKDKTVSNAATPVPAHEVEIVRKTPVVVDKNNP